MSMRLPAEITDGKAVTPDWREVPFELPRALETDEIPGIIQAYVEAARNARA